MTDHHGNSPTRYNSDDCYDQIATIGQDSLGTNSDQEFHFFSMTMVVMHGMFLGQPLPGWLNWYLIWVSLKNFHDSSDNCLMGFIYFIEIYQISHRTFGSSHWKCPTCPMIFMNTVIIQANEDLLEIKCLETSFTQEPWRVSNIFWRIVIGETSLFFLLKICNVYCVPAKCRLFCPAGRHASNIHDIHDSTFCPIFVQAPSK